MNIVIPMAGRGSRLANWQENVPKPMIQVAGKPMVAWALESLEGLDASQVVMIILSEHEERFGMSNFLADLSETSIEFVFLNHITEGQLCTVLAARDWIDTNEDVLIASADTLVRSNLALDIRQQGEDCRGLISVADLPGKHWSFARTNEDGQVVEVAEKLRISNHASTGLYYFRFGHELVSVGDEIILNREKTKGEYYVIPVYQKFIERGWKVGLSHASEVWDMGNPKAIMQFELSLRQ